MQKIKNKGIKTLILSVFMFLLVLSPAVFTPVKSQAFAPDVVAVNVAKWVWERVTDIVDRSYTFIAKELINNAVNTFISNLSYEMANYIAQGAIGGKPLFRTEDIGTVLNKAGEAAVGDFIGELTSKHFKDLGINLCDPSLDVKLTLTLKLIDSAAPPAPKCNWREVQQNWRQFSDSLSGGGWTDFIKFQLDPRQSGVEGIADFFNQFDESNSDLGTLSRLYAEQEARKQRAEEVAKITQAECQGFKDQKTVITEEVRTHCQVVHKIAITPLEQAAQADVQKLISEKDGKTVVNIGGVLRQGFSMFTRTLSGKLMEHYIRRGMWSLTQLLGNDDQSFRDDLLTLLRGGADLRAPRGVDIFRDLKTIDIRQVENYTLMEDFAICPNQEDFRSPDNCTISVEFLQLLPQRKTVAQAILDGSLNGDLPFIGPGDPRNNSDTCYLEGFCYHNMVKLRKAGVVPVGWEMAALRAPVGTSVSLEKVIECFEDVGCPFGIDPAYDNHNPYYHLVDPNWVLKAPAARCNALVYGPVLESSESNARQQYCADVQTCLREDGNGNCLDGQYGYCTRSENIWRFNGDLCEDGDIYSGCLTFANDRLGNNSYIEGTLDYCDADQVGCQRYAQERDSEGNWLLEADMTLDPATHPFNENDLFLNSQANNCPPDKDGCSEFIVMAADRGINLLPNGDITMFKGDPDDGDSDQIMGFTTTGNLEVVSSARRSGGMEYTVQVDEDITAIIDTGYDIKNRSFILSFDATGTGTIDASINQRDPLSRGIAYLRELDPAGSRQVVHGTFGEDAEGQRIEVKISGANIFTLDNIKVEEVSTFSYERRVDDIGPSNFSAYGDGGRILMDNDRFMCVEEEVGCRGYVPLNGDPLVPGIITANDICPAECVGYATFAEQPNIFDVFEGDNLPDYYNFIPTTALSCPSQEIGCEEFTNLDEVEQGGEGKEYYTYLRQCVPASYGTTYYTWQGSDVAGYQLQTVNFLESNLNDAPCTNVDPGGNTCVDEPYDPLGENAHATAACGPETEDPFDDPEFDINCRQYFDINGEDHYRLSDRVIFADNNCHPYRRTFTGQEYQAIPDLSQTCQAQFAGCRAYTGAAANNQRRLFTDNFENGSYDPWYAEGGTAIDLSNESLANGGHSMRVSSPSGFTGISRPVANIQNNKSYQLSFWMKNEGTIDSIVVSFTDGTHSALVGNINTISGGQWNRYEITSNPLTNLTGNVTLRFGTNGTGSIYLDNFILKELVDSLSYVRNSWQTPASCDNPFAGAYLGCQAYRDTNGENYNLKSFTSLCRQEAIGCQAVIATHNSTNPFAQTFNTGDYSQLAVAADSVTYLVPDVDKYCASAYKGCMALGLPEIDRVENVVTGFDTVYKLNNPDQYENTLCRSEDLYCEAFSSSKGIYYFRDPGNKTCSYQEDVNIDGDLIDGWFETDSLTSGTPELCASGREPEMPFGWSAMCPENKNLCTTFVDPADPLNCDFDNSNSDPDVPDCQSYYYYDNEKIEAGSCNGQVDQQTGCILVYDANNWNADHTEVIKLYDTEVTYNNNVALNKPVNPDTGGGGAILDANRIVKVNKDRQCAEWLACKSLTAVFNEDTSQYEMICDALDSCVEYSSTSNITQCRKWATYTPDSPLTVTEYQDRVSGINEHIQWSDKEYIGYSVPDLFPLRSLQVYDFATTTEYNDPRLVYDASDIQPEGICDGRDNLTCSVSGYAGICKDSVCWLNPTGSPTINQSEYGLATRGYAAQQAPFPKSIKGGEGDVFVLKSKYNQANVCQDGENGCEPRYKKVTYGLGSLVRYYGYKDFNAGNYAAGVCSVVDEQLQLDKKEGDSCNPEDIGDNDNAIDNDSCGVNGRCESITKVEDFINWSGICLQPDTSTLIQSDFKQSYYCNQWYPSEQIIGSQSRFNHFVEAGFYNPAGQDVNICKLTEPYLLTEDRLYCATWRDGFCNVLVQIPAGSNIFAHGAGYYSNLVDDSPSDGTGRHWKLTGEYVFEAAPADVGNPIIYGNPPSNQRYSAADFNYSNANLTANYLEDIQSLFSHSSQQLKVYFFDSGVSPDGNSNGGSIPTVLHGQAREGFADSPRGINLTGGDCREGLCGNADCAQDIVLGTGSRCSSGARNMHLASWYCRSGDICGGRRYDDCTVVCNPRTYNYYISREYNPGQICQITNCGASVASCLTNLGGRFNQVATNYNIASMDPEDNSGCGEDNDCKFAHCVLHAGAIINNDGYGFNTNYCESYHNTSTEYYVSYWDYLLHRNPVVVGGAGCSQQYYDLITPQMRLEAYGISDGDFIYRNVSGCMGNPTRDLNCVAPGGIYTSGVNGTFSCPGGDDGCYKQCSTINVIDAEGDHSKSWLRTDIWWRAANNATTPQADDDHMGTWRAYYLREGCCYPNDTNIGFSRVESTTVGPFFGGDQGLANEEIIVVEAPLNQRYFEPRASSIFFADNSNPGQADAQLRQLFARLYNLNWNGSQYTNNTITDLSSGYTNSFAGPDYLPRVFKVCGSRYCDNNGLIAPAQGITVNNKNDDSEIVGDEGNLFAAIKFYYHAHPDHMPITDLRVNWGDGDISGGLPNSKYKNNLFDCDPNQNAPGLSGTRLMGFAGTTGACHEGYKSFFHFYVWDEDNESNICSAIHASDPTAPNIFNAQCYKPVLTVTDNWNQSANWPYAGWIVIYEPEE